MSINLDKARRRMSGYWKFNSSRTVGGYLKDSIRSFAAYNSRRLELDMVAEQRLIKAKLDRAVLAGDNEQLNVA